MVSQRPHCELVIIHGWGGTYLDAAACITELLQFSCYHDHGRFLVPRREGLVLRHLFNDATDDPIISALRKLAISRFLACPPAPLSIRQASNHSYATFTEERLRQDFPALGFPLAPTARQQRADQLRDAAERTLEPALSALNQLVEAFRDNPDRDQSEQAIRQAINAMAADLLPVLEHLRGMQETGGDLDTVASAVFYARRIRGDTSRSGKACVYGRDYRFVFVNYHESLRRLKAFAPGNLYAADLPVGAFPEIATDIGYLHVHGVHTARYEDHHPWKTEQRESLQQCLREGALGMLALSGPANGSEQPETEQQCAADMVFTSCIAGTSLDTDGATKLRDAAHGEDFVRDRSPLGILLTDLIKGGICKVELAQILLDSLDDNNAMQRLEERGWATMPAIWSDDIDNTASSMLQTVSEIRLTESDTRIIMAAAVHAESDKPKLPTGRAIAFLAHTFPDAQYAFYCYGSSLMVARRLDPYNTTLNLGTLMPVIGCEADGGHAGAAVCRPDANPHYPNRLLGQESSVHFHRFSRYLAARLADAGYDNNGAQDRSSRVAATERGNSHRLGMVLLSAFLIGMLLIGLFRSFRPGPVRDSNADFFPHIVLESDDSSGEETPPDTDEATR